MSKHGLLALKGEEAVFLDEQQSKLFEQRQEEVLTHNTLWKPTVLQSFNIGALFLLVNWLIEPTQSLWLQLDNEAFWAMNNSLSRGRAWQWL